MPNKNIPNHVAIIMDGNGRWAEQRGLPRTEGHKAGVRRVREVIEAATVASVKTLTLWGYSTDNNKRPDNEKKALMGLFKDYFNSEAAELAGRGIKVTFIGDISGLPRALQLVMRSLKFLTRNGKEMHLQIALNYGGRDELLRAVNNLKEVKEKVTEEMLEKALDTSGVPDPDLVIRTSGELRLSGFMPWQTAHSELIFHNALWPDFTSTMFNDCLEEYGNRDRRFGAITAQAAE